MLVDTSGGALPGLSAPAAQHFIAAVGEQPVAKYGWTDVARFGPLGIPALNFGPGDPNQAHTRDEHVDLRLVTKAAELLRTYLA
jgi:succinyl-diaminopimelate desuccinylase